MGVAGAAASVIVSGNRTARSRHSRCYFNLGPHPPRLWPEDVDRVHRLWLELCSRGDGAKLHHRDIVGVALNRLEKQLHSEQSEEVLNDIESEVKQHPAEPPLLIPLRHGDTRPPRMS